MSLRLGARLKDVKILYPPTREWPSQILAEGPSPKGKLIRIQVHGSYAKGFPREVETFRLVFSLGRLVRIQAIYNKEYALKEPLEAAVVGLEGVYGRPQGGVWRTNIFLGGRADKD